MRFLVKVVLSALSLWLTTLVLTAEHLQVIPFGPQPAAWWQTALSYLAVALAFGIVNAVIGTFVKIVAFPIYLLTLGLVAILVNGLMLWLVDGLSSLVGWGLDIVDGWPEGFWWGVLAALVLGFINWVLDIVFRPLTKKEGRNH